MPPLRIFLADDHTIVRQGLRKIREGQADWSIVGEAGDGREAVRQVLETMPDIAVLDIGMSQLNGIEATRPDRQARAAGQGAHPEHARRRGVCDAGPAGRRERVSAQGLGGCRPDSRGPGRLGRQAFFSPVVAKVMLNDYVRRLAEKGITNRSRCALGA